MRQYYNWWFLALSGNYNSWFLDASGTIIHSTLTKQGTSFLGIIGGFHWLCWGRLWSKKFQPSIKAFLDPSPCFRGISGQILSILKPPMGGLLHSVGQCNSGLEPSWTILNTPRGSWEPEEPPKIHPNMIILWTFGPNFHPIWDFKAPNGTWGSCAIVWDSVPVAWDHPGPTWTPPGAPGRPKPPK